ncbi:MAG: hypothetical protein IPI28_19445 [Candidatus Omnitrophica bacterium]|nr:hypothetical protein [Candidatus Omnitrophota bacterium]
MSRSPVRELLYIPLPLTWKKGQPPSDDIYALAASFFHVVFDKEPFLHNGIQAKERGLNWEGLDRQEYPILSEFMDKSNAS